MIMRLTRKNHSTRFFLDDLQLISILAINQPFFEPWLTQTSNNLILNQF